MRLPHNRHFIEAILTLPYRPPVRGIPAFPRVHSLDPCFRRFVRIPIHSNHERFLDPRHIISHITQTDSFHLAFHLGTFSADFTELLTALRSTPAASRSLRDSCSRGFPSCLNWLCHKTVRMKSSPSYPIAIFRSGLNELSPASPALCCEVPWLFTRERVAPLPCDLCMVMA